MTGFARVAAFLLGASASALALAAPPAGVGPFNTDIAAGGEPYVAQLGAPGGTLPATQSWTLQAWLEPRQMPTGAPSCAT